MSITTITEVRNAQSLQSDNLRMDVEINHPDYGWIPYTVDPSDTDTTVDNAAVLALVGSSFGAYIAPTQAELDAALAAQVRAQRDSLLVGVDVVVSNPLRWASLASDRQTEWTVYRQALLDVPQQSGFPSTVVWPSAVS
ncbi:MAG: tail fiber assembly protein [Paracoccaceae bacterium]